MADNVVVDNGGLTDVDVATDKVTYSGDADRNVQLIKPVHVIGAEGSKTVVELIRAEDTVHTAADPGIPIVAVRRDADTSLVDADNDYALLQVNALGQLKVEAFSGETLPVSLASMPGQFAEDSGHTTGHTGNFVLGIRNDADADIAGTTADYSGMSVDAGGNQNVRPRPEVLRQQLAAAGLSNATYAAGEQLGNLFTFTNMARKSGGGGYITSIALLDENDLIGAVDIMFYVATVTLAADNSAASVSDADMLNFLQMISLFPTDLGANRFCQSGPIRLPYICSGGTSLYASMTTRSANAAIPGSDDIKLTLTYELS